MSWLCSFDRAGPPHTCVADPQVGTLAASGALASTDISGESLLGVMTRESGQETVDIDSIAVASHTIDHFIEVHIEQVRLTVWKQHTRRLLWPRRSPCPRLFDAVSMIKKRKCLSLMRGMNSLDIAFSQAHLEAQVSRLNNMHLRLEGATIEENRDNHPKACGERDKDLFPRLFFHVADTRVLPDS